MQNRTINIKNASKRMSNSSTCLEILTKLIGFKETNNSDKIQLPEKVKIDTLVKINDHFIKCNNDRNKNNDNNRAALSTNETKVDNETFWSCQHCTYHNPIDSITCQICGLPSNVCESLHGRRAKQHKRKNICNYAYYYCFVNVLNRIILHKHTASKHIA